MSAVALPLKFQVGARTLASVRRRLVRVPLSLADALAGAAPALAALPRGCDGYLITSLPEAQLAAVAVDGMLVLVRQRYTRYYIDLHAGEAAWRAALSSTTRSALNRKTKKLLGSPNCQTAGFCSPEGIEFFHCHARVISAKTYQERLLGAGLPADAKALMELALQNRARAWLLVLDGKSIAYLFCSADGDTLRYDHVGHDPAYAALSPGTVLQAAALHDLFEAGDFARFDFTEGEGQHKRSLATGGVACVDLLLLRPTLDNRALLAALAWFDAAMRHGKNWAASPRLQPLARRLRRA